MCPFTKTTCNQTCMFCLERQDHPWNLGYNNPKYVQDNSKTPCALLKAVNRILTLTEVR
jgi:hypothetical protein